MSGERRFPWGRGVLLFATAALLAGFCATSLRVSSDITHFMPRGGEPFGQALSQRLLHGDLSRTLVVAVGAGDTAESVEAARWLEVELASNTAVETVRGGVDPAALETLAKLFIPRRYYFASPHPEQEIPEQLEPAALAASARQLRQRLAGPTAGLVSRLAADDPLLLSMRLLERLRSSSASIELHAGRFVSQDRGRAILFVTTRASAYDAARQAPFLDDLDALRDELRTRFDADATLELSGIHPFAAHIERDMRRDMWKISLVSMLGVASVFLLFYRSLRALLVCVVPHLMGVLVALSFATWFFGTLTHLALLFAVALAGVSIDYSIHLLSHIAFQKERSRLGWLHKSLALGAITTVASFVGLGLSTFPGFDQMGWVAAVGVATALVISVFALPPMLAAAKPRAAPAVAGRLAEWLNLWEARPRALLTGAAAVAVAGVLSAGAVHWTDDVSALTKIDPALLAEDEDVRGRIHRLDLSRFVVARGPDLEAALRSNDLAAERLRELVRSDALGGFDSLHSFLWSADLQRRNLEAFRTSPDLVSRVERAFSAEGFRTGAFAGLARSLEHPPPPLRLRDLERTAAAAAAAAQVLELPEGVAIVTFLRAVRDLPALAESMADLPTVELFDQKRFVESVYAEYRERILRIVLSGTLIVFAILWARYRSLRLAAAAISPSLLTVAALTLVAAISGTTLHLIHLLSLVLVMGMGVDYGIFTVDTERQGESMGTTQLGLLVSCLTTLFVFGSLALSSYPALRAMGLTTGLGLLFSFLFSPVAVVLLRSRRAT